MRRPWARSVGGRDAQVYAAHAPKVAGETLRMLRRRSTPIHAMKSSTTLLCFSVGLLLGSSFVSGCSSTRTRESTGEYIDSSALTAKVKSALVADEIVRARDVQVETFRGTVQLSGFVDTQAQKERATAVARSVQGVRDVKNNLIIK
jgi:osmotically-inducible protein OsmY